MLPQQGVRPQGRLHGRVIQSTDIDKNASLVVEWSLTSLNLGFTMICRNCLCTMFMLRLKQEVNKLTVSQL